MKHTLWNLISCLKNGSLAKKAHIRHRKKHLSERVLTVLWDQGYISGYKNDPKNKKKIIVFLKYNHKIEPGIKKIKAISKPGKRVYFSVKQILKLNSTNTFVIISTNLGLKSLEECKRLKIGGELLLLLN